MTGVGGRPEVILEGSDNQNGPWKEYHFMYKPGNISYSPPSMWMHQASENMNNNEFLPGRYTDLTFEAESGSIHSAPNRKSQDFFRGFHL